MLTITKISDGKILPPQYGGKAIGLSLLCVHGYTIPDTIAIEACRDICIYDSPDFQSNLQANLVDWDNDGIFDIAVRSSCTTEDGFKESMAGYFDTIIEKMTFADIITNIKKVVSGLSRLSDTTVKMGVIVQKKVDAEYSGAIFSSNPYTYSKKSMIISFVSGIAVDLLSGFESGNDVSILVRDDNYTIDGVETDIQINEKLLLLSRMTKELEHRLNYPLDIEWAIVGTDIIFLQCRPITSITKVRTEMQLVNESNLNSLPQILVSHDKIKLRLFAQKNGVMISDAYVYIHNTCSATNYQIPEISRTEHCVGYSAVIIYPQLLSNKVVRSFVGDTARICDNVKTCCRYGVRSFPKYENLENCLFEYSSLVSDEYWISTTVIQEMFDPLYTGAVQRISNGILFEITRGHFLSKGVVPTSWYLTDEFGNVLDKQETNQREWHKIIEGSEIFCICNDGEDDTVSLPDDTVKKIVNYLKKAFSAKNAVVEFGVLRNGQAHYQPYLIDFFDDNSDVNVSPTDIQEGIISRGKITGRIVHVNEDSSDSFNLHLYDGMKENDLCEDSIVFFCEKPYISLLSLLRTHNTKKIGFVFNECALLCHFAVVLREMGIPALKVGTIFGYSDGICTIDAESSGITAKARLSK